MGFGDALHHSSDRYTLLIGKLTIHLHIGILWSLVAAVGLTGQIIGTTALIRGISVWQLVGLQSVGAAMALILAIAFQGLSHPAMYAGLFQWPMRDWIWIGYLALLATLLAVFLQSWGQRRISATEAALVFNMEPMWTAVFAWVILSQHMTIPQFIGAGLIIGSLTLVSRSRRSPEHNV